MERIKIKFPVIRDTNLVQENTDFGATDFKSKQLKIMIDMLEAQQHMVNKMMRMAKTPNIKQENDGFKMWDNITLKPNDMVWGAPQPFISIPPMTDKEFEEFEERWKKVTTNKSVFIPTVIHPKIIDKLKEDQS